MKIEEELHIYKINLQFDFNEKNKQKKLTREKIEIKNIELVEKKVILF